jgi:hypothetical protein
MGEAKVGGEFNGDDESNSLTTDELDPSAYIGHEPEREAESIPGGIKPEDERLSAYNSRPGVEGEPDERDAPDSPPAYDDDSTSVAEDPARP